MHIVHVTETLSHEAGGLTLAVSNLAALGPKRGWASTIVSTGPTEISHPGVHVTGLRPRHIGTSWLWASDLGERLEKTLLSKPATVLHVHGVWMAPQLCATRIAARHRIPVILSPHNMLSRWGWQRQGALKGIKKQLYWQLIGSRVFGRSKVIHAITASERDELKHYFPRSRIEIIPPFVHDPIPQRHSQESHSRDEDPERRIVFLGRIHPVKGLDLLVEAFARSGLPPDWSLTVIGPVEDGDYFEAIRQAAVRLGISDSVHFSGAVFNEDKYRYLAQAWIVAVPSWTEVVGMVNLESAVCGTPTITTFETGLSEWEAAGGLLCRPEVSELAGKLRQVSHWSMTERKERGRKLRKHVLSNYSEAIVGAKWEGLYRKLVGGV